jgi:hypothetical protein
VIEWVATRPAQSLRPGASVELPKPENIGTEELDAD